MLSAGTPQPPAFVRGSGLLSPGSHWGTDSAGTQAWGCVGLPRSLLRARRRLRNYRMPRIPPSLLGAQRRRTPDRVPGAGAEPGPEMG